MLKHLAIYLLAAAASPAAPIFQAASTSAPAPAKPTERVIGTIATVDPSFKTITVQDDKTKTDYSVSLENTKTFLKVAPDSKDLKTAARFDPSDLKVGDRVSVRGFKMEAAPNGVAAASVLLMSARDLQQAHRNEMQAWQQSTAGIVDSVDAATKQLKVNIRTPEGPKVMAVDGTSASFTRYSPASPKAPVASELSDIRPGDQIRVIAEHREAGAIIVAKKIYSGTFRTVVGTIASISPDAKEVTVNDRRTKQPVQFTITGASAVRQLPPQAAIGLLHRSPGASKDLSQTLDSLPKLDISSLKPGEAVIASGGTGPNHEGLTATNIVTGVEPLLQSAPAARRRGNQSSGTGNDWSLDLAIPSE